MPKKKRRLHQLSSIPVTVLRSKTRSLLSLRSKRYWQRTSNSMITAPFDDERGATETMGSHGSEHREESMRYGSSPEDTSMDLHSEPLTSKNAKQKKFLAKLKEIAGRHVESLPEERRSNRAASWQMTSPSPVNTPEVFSSKNDDGPLAWPVQITPISPPVISKTPREASNGTNGASTSANIQAVASSVQAVVRSVSSGCVSFQNMCSSHEQVLFGESNGMVGMEDVMDQHQTKVRQTYIDRMPKELLREASPPTGARDGSPPMPASISFVKRDNSSLRRSPTSPIDGIAELTTPESQSVCPSLTEDKYKVERDTSLLSSIMIVTDYGPGDDDNDSMTSSIPTRHSHHLYSPP